VQALTNLGGEKAQQLVLNYDSMTWLSGSFYSDATASNEPDNGHRFIGFVASQDANNIVLNAVDLDSTPVGARYQRVKKDGVWNTWEEQASNMANLDARYVNTWPAGDTMLGHLTLPTGPAAANAVRKDYVDAAVSAGDALRVARAGDVMSGNLTITMNTPQFTLNNTGAAGSTYTYFMFLRAGAGRWDLASTPPNDDFTIDRYNDAGARIDAPLSISRSSGNATFAAGLSANGVVTSLGGFSTTANSQFRDVFIDGDLTIAKVNPLITLNASAGQSAVRFQIGAATQSTIYDNGSGIIVASNAANTQGMYILHGQSVWTALSDARSPEKVGAKPLTMLDRIDKLQVYENNYEGSLRIFVIVQEFVKVLPHLVKVGSASKEMPKDIASPEAWGVAYDRAGVAALQLGKEIYDTLLQKIAALEARVAALEA
jgi:hypothetical protein